MGYVGLPVAVSFGQTHKVVGFDVNEGRVEELSMRRDATGEVSQEELSQADILFTTDPFELRSCDFFIIAVPTPVDHSKQPDLSALEKASEIVGQQLSEGTIVVYESTVYPGTTEEVCIPLLEKYSGLTAGRDFFVGYSPERINPGDRQRQFKQIVKVVSGQTREVCDVIADVYGMVVEAGVFRASSIKVAEAAKVIENTQRDLNIALMNELAIIFKRLGIDTGEVLEAARTKWNFLSFTPGLVGGHCIGVDPYYLTYKAESIGYHPQVILAGRRINDSMGHFVAASLVKQMILQNIPIQGSKVSILGVTFKENVRDIRNSKVIDIVRELQSYGVEVQVTDALADPKHVARQYGLPLTPLFELEPANSIALIVPHEEYKHLSWEQISGMLIGGRGVVLDLKGILDPTVCPHDIFLWRL